MCATCNTYVEWSWTRMLWWLPVNWTSQFVFDHQTVDISLLFSVYLCFRRQTPVSCFSLTSTFQCCQVRTFKPLSRSSDDRHQSSFLFYGRHHSTFCLCQFGHTILDSRQLDISLLSFRSLCVNSHVHLTFFPSGAYYFGCHWIYGIAKMQFCW